VDESFRTLGAAGRSVQGWSKGGQGALLLALKHPGEFCSVAAFAPGLATGAARGEKRSGVQGVH
jgi:S-formylglutathione hydrolase FrmB